VYLGQGQLPFQARTASDRKLPANCAKDQFLFSFKPLWAIVATGSRIDVRQQASVE